MQPALLQGIVYGVQGCMQQQVGDQALSFVQWPLQHTSWAQCDLHFSHQA